MRVNAPRFAMWWMEREGRLIVVAHGDEPATDAQFQQLLQHGRAATETGPARLLVYAAGRGGPNAEQRKAIGTKVSTHADSSFKTVVVTHSAVVRGILTALTWVTPMTTQAFSPKDLDKAADALELDQEERKTLDRLLASVIARGGLPPVDALAAE